NTVCITAYSYIFFFSDTPTTEIYTLSLHDALPIYSSRLKLAQDVGAHTVLSATLDVARQVGELTREAGVDAAIEAVGQGDSVKADRKSTRLNSSHVKISYAVFCLKKKKNHE